MLPDFQTQKSNILELVDLQFKKKVSGEGLLSLIKRVPYFEGDRFESSDVDGAQSNHPARQFTAQFQPDRERIVAIGPQYLVEVFDSQVERLQSEHFELFRERLDEGAARTGNSVNAGGRPFTFDLYLELMEKVQWDFHDDGRPDLDSRALIVSPEMGNYLEAQVPRWLADPEYQRRFESLVEKKREEWRDRESDCKLVDDDE